MSTSQGSDRVFSLRAIVARFGADKRGNVAVIFAVALLPILGLIGAAVDYSRANNARTALQTALDTTALMISKDAANLTANQIQTRAQQYFNALYTRSAEAPVTDLTATYTPNSGSGASIVMSANSSIQTDFLKVMGNQFNQIAFNGASTTKWGSTRMRVAMVLDNTGSMADNGKMAAMQSAARDMIDTLSSYNTTTGDVYISIVPFAKDVNVDTSNVNAGWINWTEWKGEPPYLGQIGYPNNLASWQTPNVAGTWIDMTGPGSSCPFSSNTHGFSCTNRPATFSGAQSTSSIPSSGNYKGMICPSLDSGRRLSGKTSIYYNGCYTSVAVTLTLASGSSASCSGKPSGCTCSGSGSNKKCTLAAYRHDWRNVPADPNAVPAADTNLTQYAAPNPAATAANGGWAGCINDRDQSYDTTNAAPGGSDSAPSTKYYAEQWKDCLSATIGAMSNNWSDLKQQITDMSPNGNTNQAVGLAWGWQTLNTSNDPFKAPATDPNWVYKDYIVLLSDGLNTQNRWSTSQSAIDARQEILCQNIKDPTFNNGKQITVFTIQVNINNRDPSSQVLKDCATNSSYYQMITSANQTASAFQNVLTQIAKLRITK